MKKKIIYYEDSKKNKPVKEFINNLDTKIKAKVLARLIDMSENWDEYNRRPYIGYLEDDLSEIRIQFAKNKIRIIYAYMVKDHVVLLHGLFKNTSKITKTDKLRAKKRLLDFQIRYNEGEIKLK